MRALFLVVLLASCSSPNAPDPADVSVPTDTADRPDTAVDVAVAMDMGGDSEVAVTVPDTAGCDAGCDEFDLTLDSAGIQATFEHARYGLTPPTMSNSGQWEVYVEVYRGGVPGCPTETSPTPDQTLIVSGLPVPTAPITVTETEGLSVVMLDFEGLVTTEPILRATGEEASIVAWNVCTDCPGAQDEDGSVSFDLSAPLDDGSIAGRVVATHCLSLDTPE